MGRMLVTGGAGFIGANFVGQTVRDYPEYEVTALDALTYAGDVSNLSPVVNDIEFIEGNVCDVDLVGKLVRDNDVVVHFAAESHVDNSLVSPETFIQSNIVGTFNLLEAIRKYSKRLHHISTDEVFGDLQLDSAARFTEETPYNPSNPYSASKAASDMLVRAWVRSFDIEATLSNCANNYGPYQHIEKFIARQITNVLGGQRPKLFGSGHQMREWTHVEDHNTAVHSIISKGRLGETYLIGSGEEINNMGVVKLILEILGQPTNNYDLVADRAGHDTRYAVDSTKLKSELKWEPQYRSLREGLASTIDWYKNNEDWWRDEKANVEAFYARKGQ